MPSQHFLSNIKYYIRDFSPVEIKPLKRCSLSQKITVLYS